LQFNKAWFQNVKSYSEITIHFRNFLPKQFVCSIFYYVEEYFSQLNALYYSLGQLFELQVDFLLKDIDDLIFLVGFEEQLAVPECNGRMLFLERKVYRISNSDQNRVCFASEHVLHQREERFLMGLKWIDFIYDDDLGAFGLILEDFSNHVCEIIFIDAFVLNNIIIKLRACETLREVSEKLLTVALDVLEAHGVIQEDL
jgi:hypothetical protein